MNDLLYEEQSDKWCCYACQHTPGNKSLQMYNIFQNEDKYKIKH